MKNLHEAKGLKDLEIENDATLLTEELKQMADLCDDELGDCDTQDFLEEAQNFEDHKLGYVVNRDSNTIEVAYKDDGISFAEAKTELMYDVKQLRSIAERNIKFYDKQLKRIKKMTQRDAIK